MNPELVTRAEARIKFIDAGLPFADADMWALYVAEGPCRAIPAVDVVAAYRALGVPTIEAVGWWHLGYPPEKTAYFRKRPGSRLG